jgi:hypothetical protein
MTFFIISAVLTTKNITCKYCGMVYNACGNSHCCDCKKVYTSAICDTSGNIFTYSHCCKCDDEFSDDWDDHACFKH